MSGKGRPTSKKGDGKPKNRKNFNRDKYKILTLNDNWWEEAHNYIKHIPTPKYIAPFYYTRNERY